jgi:hypothetical protein
MTPHLFLPCKKKEEEEEPSFEISIKWLIISVDCLTTHDSVS